MFEGLFQPMHLAIILVIVVIVFGTGKLGQVGGALGKSIREFKKATSNDDYVAPPAASVAPGSDAPVLEAKLDTSADEVARLRKQIDDLKASMKAEPTAGKQ